MTSTPESDPRLTGAHDLALAALHEITPASTVGPPAGFAVEEDGSVSLRFENRLPGYPGWYWTVTVARVDGEEPTVLELEMMPGDGALLAPEWVPWAERLADYRAHQAALAEQAAADAVDDADADDDDSDADDSDDDDLNDDDEDDFDSAVPVLHSGDLDGVDIDELDPSIADDDESDDDPDSDDDDDESDSDDDDDDESEDDDESDDEGSDDESDPDEEE